MTATWTIFSFFLLSLLADYDLSHVKALSQQNLSRRDAITAAAFGVFVAPSPAFAAPDCFKDCMKNCKLIAPKDPDYCLGNCKSYCEQDDR